MPQLGTADVTYTAIVGTHEGSPSVPEKAQQFLLTFPNASNVLYTNGGIPLGAQQLGCPAYLQKFLLLDDGSSVGYVAKWDQKANAIRLYQSGAFGTGSAVAATALTELTTAATVASTTLRVLAQGW